MILRRPYAFFIKYFKVLHWIIAVFTLLILLRTLTLFSFFSAYTDDYQVALSEYSPASVLNIYSFLMTLVILIASIVLLSVMIFKKKPKGLYIYNIILYILIMVLYVVCYSNLVNIDSIILDIRVSSALRDLAFAGVVLEAASLILTIVRATGFDIKNFDFGTDLQKLDIDEKDSEEIEVAIEFDKNKTKRNFRNRLRNAKYVYFENKFIINTVAVVLVVVIAFVIYFSRGIYSVTYSQGKVFSASDLTVSVRDSYITNTSPDGDLLTNNALVVVKLDLRAYGNKMTLNTGLATLHIGNLSYSQNPAFAKSVYDLGTPYTGQTLTSEFTSYILAYEVPLSLVDRELEFQFNDNVSYVNGEIGAKDIIVKLEPQDLREKGKTYESTIAETLEFDDSILGGTTVTIDSYEIADRFRYDYNYCYGTNKCIDSYEYITPTATGSYDKTLMKIKGTLSVDSNINSGFDSWATFMNTFASITYVIDDQTYTRKIDTQDVKATAGVQNGIYYIEVPREVGSASSIYFTFNVRNNSYNYVLK